MNRSVGIVVDGGFIRKVLSHQKKQTQTANDLYQAILSVKQQLLPTANLFRIFYYDGVPDPCCQKTFRHPLDGSRHKLIDQVDFPTHQKLFEQMKQKPFVAFRYGELSFQGWQVRNIRQLRQKVASGGSFEPEDCYLKIAQKRVDIKMGLDIATMATKRLVDSLILIAGDSDLVPAMKLARREGMQVFLATFGHPVCQAMYEHSDTVLR